MAGGYQLWAPWSPLDESLQWLRGATPRPCTKHPFRGVPRGSCAQSSSAAADLEVQLCFQGLSLVLEPGAKGPGLPAGEPRRGAALRKPQAVRLSGLDSVFGRLVTAQPPRWTGSFRVSERSAFCQVISPRQRWPRGLREPQVRMAVAMCRQMLRAILLLYAAYKKCAFALQHSR